MKWWERVFIIVALTLVMLIALVIVLGLPK
jgi:hypothetical protein